MATPYQSVQAYLRNRRAARKTASQADENIKKLEALLFDKQLAVHRDTSLEKALLTTARAGKTTYHAVTSLISMCEHPGANEWTGYVTLTKGQSRRNMEGPLKEIIRDLKLPVRQSEPDGQITFTHANGHRLWLGGVDDMRATEVWRGNKWRRFKIDEAGAWPDPVLTYFIDDVIAPRLSDLGGVFEISGTPGFLPKGLFWEITTDGELRQDGEKKRPKWSTHSWSVVDNPHHPWGMKEIEELRVKRGWALNNPTLLREWFGKWVTDLDAIIYHYDGTRNCSYELPDWPEWRFVLGVDVGHNDDTAFVLTASRIGFAEVYALRAWGGPAMTQPERAQHILRTQAALKETYGRQARVVVDTGGLGKALAFDLTKTYGVACEGADKKQKAAAIRVVQGMLLSGTLKVHPFSPNPDQPLGFGAQRLLTEWAILPWNDERTDHEAGYADHCSDACLYAVRMHPTFERWDKKPPAHGSPEHLAEAMAARKKLIAERVKTKQDSSLSRGEKRERLKRLGGRR